MTLTLLALETSTDACSVALLHQGTYFTETQQAPRMHGKFILPMIEKLLAQATCSFAMLDAVAAGVGPGSFTGVRLAVSVAQGIAFAIEKPVIAVSSLQALAQQAHRLYQAKQVLAATDARMSQIYWNFFSYHAEGLMIAEHPDGLMNPEQLHRDDLKETVLIGNAFSAYASSLNSVINHAKTCYASALPLAQDIAEIARVKWNKGEVLSPHELEPCYVRNDVTHQ